LNTQGIPQNHGSLTIIKTGITQTGNLTITKSGNLLFMSEVQYIHVF